MEAPEQSSMQSVWDLPGSLTDIAWFRDWDYYIASFSSVQKYWQDHGTIPLWNFHFCGGRPEIANPQNWTLTWLHPFIYMFSPVYLILVMWLVLTTVGTIATAAIIHRRTAHWPSAILAGATYGLSGYFSAHFNQGIFTFAFFHLVPVMMLITDIRADKPTTRNSIGLFVASTAFFTAALPHGLFYFYPAYLLFAVGVVFMNHRHHFFKRLTDTVYPHLLAAGVAGYKIIPVAAWQKIYPRQGVQTESLNPLSMLGNMLRTDSSYDNMFAQAFDGQFWFLWEYNAFIGWLPLLGALLTGILAVRWLSKKDRGSFGLLIIASIISVAGIALASGNEYQVSPGYWFKYLPLVGGIRVFGRFQILIVFGFALLFGIGLRQLFTFTEKFSKSQVARPVIIALVFGLTMVPLLLQVSLHIKNIRGIPYTELNNIYNPKPNPHLVLGAMNADFTKKGVTHHDYILRHNGSVANCYDPLTIERPPVMFSQENRWLELSNPPPSMISVRSDSLQLHYETSETDSMTLFLTQGHYPISFSKHPIAAASEWGKSQHRFNISRSDGLTVSATIPGWTAGWLLSAASSVAFVASEILRRLRERSKSP